MSTPPHIAALLGKRVRVESPNDASRWEGTLVSYSAEPSIVIRQDDHFFGHQVTLPAAYQITELPPPEWHPCPACNGRGSVPLLPQEGGDA